MEEKKEEAIRAFTSAAKWEAWLAKHHASAPGLWLRLFKKNSGKQALTYAEALDAALCYGWIDAQKKALDEESWIQRFCPRKAKGGWSKLNTAHAQRLIKAKRMRPAGLKAIEAAQADGRWKAAYDSPSQHKVPTDLLKALEKDKKAKAFFLTLDRANTYAISYRLQTAKKPETRAKRFGLILGMLKKGEKFH